MQAYKIAEICDVIDKLANGYNTKIGEHGVGDIATILFIAHHIPKGLAVDEVLTLSGEKATQMRLVEEGN